MKHLLIFTLILSALSSFAQLPKKIFPGDWQEEYKPGDFIISKKPIAQSAGVYHFGESEGESNFIVLPFKTGIIVQVFSHNWGKDPKTKQGTWLREFKTFNNVTVQGSTFKFGKYKGIFAAYKGNIKKVIILNGDPSSNELYGKDSAEAGNYKTDLATYFNDKKYPEVSIKIINEKYLAGKTIEQLKYMRNEVFAKYGLIFQNPATAALFRKRYLPWRKDVSMCLTDIEKHNLDVIKSYEAKVAK